MPSRATDFDCFAVGGVTIIRPVEGAKQRPSSLTPNMSAPIEHLATLTRDIAQLETDAARLEIERRAVAKAVGRLARRHRYLRFAGWFRSPAGLFSPWPGAVFAVGPLVVGVLFLLLLSLICDSWTVPFVGFFFGMVGGAIVFATFLYLPPGTALLETIPQVESRLQLEQARLDETTDQIIRLNRQLQELLEARRALVASEKLKCAMLLDRNWKAMRGDEWENYLVEVCRTLGAKVERTGKSGDQGVDLIVEFGPRRVAVQAKGYYHSVNSEAVRQAVAGVAFYECNASAVITNSTFTPGAKELAASNRCTVIGEGEFPDFVMGKLPL
jgi:hypothetical protein